MKELPSVYRTLKILNSKAYISFCEKVGKKPIKDYKLDEEYKVFKNMVYGSDEYVSMLNFLRRRYKLQKVLKDI